MRLFCLSSNEDPAALSTKRVGQGIESEAIGGDRDDCAESG
jgi:hypothetical protein